MHNEKENCKVAKCAKSAKPSPEGEGAGLSSFCNGRSWAGRGICLMSCEANHQRERAEILNCAANVTACCLVNSSGKAAKNLRLLSLLSLNCVSSGLFRQVVEHENGVL